MATYQTKQKKELVGFLTAHPDQAFTIEEIIDIMAKEEPLSPLPSQSTVYRLMASLLEEGVVTRLQSGVQRKASYQLMGGNRCHDHFHMKCTGCGRLFHTSDKESDKLVREIQSQTHFTVDMTQTLIYGICASCQQKGAFHER
ncbi:MAG: transcriptional repressor [Firmicutes bacterium]|nr:transcriptional repressor [Bacillota bacterium]